MDQPENQTSQLIPVRIRGKNTHDRAHNKRKLIEDSTATEPSRSRGRPLKRLSTAVVLSSSHSTASSSSSSASVPKKRRRSGPKPSPELKLSSLELLPVELLQNIFLYSLNLALPLCSPRIGSALSSKYVRTELVTHAFWDCVSKVDGRLREFKEHDAEMVEKYKTLQSGLLRLKWMTLDFYMECMDNFLAETAACEFGALLTKYGLEGPFPTKDEYHELLIHYRPWASPCSLLPLKWLGVTCNCGHHTLERAFRDERRLVLRLHEALLGLRIYIVEPLPSDLTPLTVFDMSRYHPRGYIPSKLLHGPWTKERCEYLELLTEAGFSVDLLHTSDSEIAEKGLEDAIRERNLRALAVLVATVRPPGFQNKNGARSKEDGASDYSPTVYDVKDDDYVHPRKGYLSPVAVLPQTTHLRLAVIECDCAPVIVYHLLRADLSLIDLEDSELVGWAVEKKKQGDWRGQWLLKILWKASMLGYHTQRE